MFVVLTAVTLSPQAVKRVRNSQQSVGKDGRKHVHCYLRMRSGVNDAVPGGVISNHKYGNNLHVLSVIRGEPHSFALYPD